MEKKYIKPIDKVQILNKQYVEHTSGTKGVIVARKHYGQFFFAHNNCEYLEYWSIDQNPQAELTDTMYKYAWFYDLNSIVDFELVNEGQ